MQYIHIYEALKRNFRDPLLNEAKSIHLNETHFICLIALIFDLDEFCRKAKQNYLPLRRDL